MRCIALILLAALPALACDPAEIGGEGSSMRKAADPRTYNAVLVWTCPDGKQEWVGLRDKTNLILPRDGAALRLHLSKLRVQHGYDGRGMSDLAPLVSKAK